MAEIKEIRWSAPEYHYYEKPAFWYWGVGIVFSIIIGLALWQRNFLFAIFMGIAGFLVSSWGEREPQTIDFSLTEKELTINNTKSYAYEKLAGFAIIENPGRTPELVIKSKERLRPWMRIIIPQGELEHIKTFLAAHISEIEYEESMSDHIGRMLKF